MKTFLNLVLVQLCLLVGVLRFALPVSGKINQADFFKDLAHIFVGILIGWAIAGTFKDQDGERQSDWRFRWALAIGLTVLEVVAFFVRQQ